MHRLVDENNLEGDMIQCRTKRDANNMNISGLFCERSMLLRQLLSGKTVK